MSINIISSDDARQLKDLIAKLMRGERDPEAAKKARERMDRMREETRQRVGTLDVAVDLVRELRERRACSSFET